MIPSAAALFLVAEGDVNMVLTPLYERLMDINRNAVAMKAETTCIHVIRAFGSIASYTVNFKAAAFPAHEAPLTHMPIHYLRKCVELVQRHELDDAALEGSHILLQAAQSAPDNVQILHVHLPAIDGCYEIARTFLTTTTPNKATLVNEFLRDIMTLAHHLVQQRHFMADHVLQHILEKNLELAPYALLHEKALGAPVIIMPLALPYDVTNEYSLSHLVRRAASLIDWSEYRAWAKSYGDFRELNEKIWRHFRDLVEKVDLGQSWLLWDITGTIQHIAQLYLCLLKEPMTNDAHYVDELAAQLRWYLSFFWEAFSKANVVDLTYAKHASETLGWVGLTFLDVGHKKITQASANNIVSIAKYGSPKIDALSADQIADLLMPIWYMRMLAEAKQDDPMVNLLDSKLVKPETMTDALWQEAQQALEDSKDEIEMELSDDYHNLGMYAKNKNLLKNLLQKYWHEADNSGNS
jgi:hypothetical protein